MIKEILSLLSQEKYNFSYKARQFYLNLNTEYWKTIGSVHKAMKENRFEFNAFCISHKSQNRIGKLFQIWRKLKYGMILEYKEIIHFYYHSRNILLPLILRSCEGNAVLTYHSIKPWIDLYLQHIIYNLIQCVLALKF